MEKNLKRVLLLLTGTALSYYALSLEKARADDPEHEALCDIAPAVSCTAAFESEYGTGFGIICPIVGDDHILCQKNSVYGLLSYLSMIPLVLTENLFAAEILLFMSLGSICISVFLAWVLWMQKNFCIVCGAIYIVNIWLLKLNWSSRLEIMATKYSDLEKEEIKKNN